MPYDNDSPFAPSGDSARPVQGGKLGIMSFLFLIGGIGMFLSPINMVVTAVHHPATQDPGTCEYIRHDHPDWDPTTFGCDPK